MSLFWGRDSNLWTPNGGRHVPWPDLATGDLIASGRKPWRVIEVRPVPVVDWDEQDRRYPSVRQCAGLQAGGEGGRT